MKSTIRIDLDEDNQPFIKIHYVESEDLRDKFVKRFLEKFGSASCWARFQYIDTFGIPDEKGYRYNLEKQAAIIPIAGNNPTELALESAAMEKTAKEQGEIYGIGQKGNKVYFEN